MYIKDIKQCHMSLWCSVLSALFSQTPSVIQSCLVYHASPALDDGDRDAYSKRMTAPPLRKGLCLYTAPLKTCWHDYSNPALLYVRPACVQHVCPPTEAPSHALWKSVITSHVQWSFGRQAQSGRGHTYSVHVAAIANFTECLSCKKYSAPHDGNRLFGRGAAFRKHNYCLDGVWIGWLFSGTGAPPAHSESDWKSGYGHLQRARKARLYCVNRNMSSLQ